MCAIAARFWHVGGAARAAPTFDDQLCVKALVVVMSGWGTPVQWSLYDASRVVSLVAAGASCVVQSYRGVASGGWFAVAFYLALCSVGFVVGRRV